MHITAQQVTLWTGLAVAVVSGIVQIATAVVTGIQNVRLKILEDQVALQAQNPMEEKPCPKASTAPNP